jgi:hypothetical protein
MRRRVSPLDAAFFMSEKKFAAPNKVSRLLRARPAGAIIAAALQTP